MKKTLVLNDTHFGCVRQGGSTPATQVALRRYQYAFVEKIISPFMGRLILNGDIFDGFTVETADVIETYRVLGTWLFANDANELVCVMGNHDASAKAAKVSSFHLLAYFLLKTKRVTVVDNTSGLTQVGDRIWAISHCLNQDLFELELQKAMSMEVEATVLLLHTNYKNTFAEGSSTSLNLNDEQVGALMRAGFNLLIGHEHVGYNSREGRVVVTGTQFPTSVSDCINDPDKRAILIEDGIMTPVVTWQAEGNFIDVDWRELDKVTTHQFVRVSGSASAAEAAEVINLISKLRQSSDAFVITNAVQIEGKEALADAAEKSIESIRSFDVLSAVLAELDEKEAQIVREVMA